MLGRLVRKQQRAQWLYFARNLTCIPTNKYGNVQIFVTQPKIGPPNALLSASSWGLPPTISRRTLYVDALDEAYLDKYFEEYDMKEPMMPLIPVRRANTTLQSHLEAVWRKAAQSDYRNIVDALKAWQQDGNVITRDVINKLLIRLYSRMFHYQGYKLMNWVIQEKPFEITDFDHLVRLDFAVRELKVAKAVTCFNRIKTKSPTAYILLLQAFTTGHRRERAEALFKEMKDQVLITHSYAYNLMIGMYLRMGLHNEAMEVYNELVEKSNVFPDAFTYWILIRSKDRLGMDDLEEKIEDYFATIENIPAGFEWRTLIKLYGAMGKKTEVERLWREQKRAEHLPETYFLAATEAFGLIGDMKRVEEISQQLEKQNTKLTDRQCFAMVKVYCINGAMLEAEKMINKMEELGYKLGFRIYHYLVSGYVKRHQYIKAIEKFNEAMEKGMDKGFKNPLFVTVLTLLDAYAHKKDLQKAEEMVEKVIKTRHYPYDIRIFNALLKVYLKSEKPAWGMEKRIKDANLEPDEVTHKLIRKLNAFNP